MLEFLFRWDVGGVIIGILLTVGWGALAVSDYLIAKTCFLLASCELAGIITMWGLKSSPSAVVRIPVVAFCFAIVGIIAVESLRYVDAKADKAGPSAEQPKSEQPAQDAGVAKSVQQSAALLQLEGSYAYKDFSLIATGKKLAFKFSFKNHGPLLVTHPRIIVVGALSPVPNDQQYRMLIDSLQQAVQNTLAQDNGSYRAPDVSIGMETDRDFAFIPLESWQAAGILNGTIRMYFYIYADWKGSDGLNGSSKTCLWMPTPQSKKLKAENIKHWNVCPLPDSPAQPAIAKTTMSRDWPGDWRLMEDGFRRHAPSSLRATWQRSAYGAIENWMIHGDQQNIEREVRAFCKQSGRLLKISPMSKQLSPEISGQPDDENRWLYFLQEKHGLSNVMTATETVDGKKYAVTAGEIYMLAAVSASACVECAAMSFTD